MFVCRYYRIYDIGREIDLAYLEKALTEDPAAGYSLGRAGFQRVKPKSIMLEAQPLMLKMDPFLIEREGQHLEFSVVAKIYDIGALSLCFIYEDMGSPVAPTGGDCRLAVRAGRARRFILGIFYPAYRSPQDSPERYGPHSRFLRGLRDLCP